MSEDLFAAGDEAKRDRLRALGWKKVWRFGQLFWENVWGDLHLSEAEAFAWLGRHEKEKHRADAATD